MVSVADDDGDPDDDLPGLGVSSLLEDFMGYGDGFHIAPYGDPDPPSTPAVEEACVAAANVTDTFQIEVPWATQDDSSVLPACWGSSSQGQSSTVLTAYALPTDDVATVVARVAAGGNEGHGVTNYWLRELASQTMATELDNSRRYELIQEQSVEGSMLCFDTIHVQFPWVYCAPTSTDVTGQHLPDRWQWVGRNAPSQHATVLPWRASPDTRVKALIEEMARGWTDADQCGLSCAGGQSELPREASLHSLGPANTLYEFIVDEAAWKESLSSLEQPPEGPPASASVSLNLNRSFDGNSSFNLQQQLQLMDLTPAGGQEEYRVLRTEGRSSYEYDLVIDTHQITMRQRKQPGASTPWFQLNSINEVEQELVANIRSVDPVEPLEEVPLLFMWTEDR